jgi:hypothetical protein
MALCFSEVVDSKQVWINEYHAVCKTRCCPGGDRLYRLPLDWDSDGCAASEGPRERLQARCSGQATLQNGLNRFSSPMVVTSMWPL